jgi:hypothetical protein
MKRINTISCTLNHAMRTFRPFIGPIKPGFTKARRERPMGATKFRPAPSKSTVIIGDVQPPRAVRTRRRYKAEPG